MKKYDIVFFGTPDFSVPSLELLLNHPLINIKNVISMPDRPAGRGKKLQSPPVAEFAKENGIPLLQTDNINKEVEWIEKVRLEKVDFFVVLAFAQFLGEKLLNIPRLGCFNIHTSLLPKFRGAAPIQYALLNGESVTGISIQKMEKKMDAGDVAITGPKEIFPYETGGLLYTRLKFACVDALAGLIDDINNNKLELTAQDESQVSFAPPLDKKDGFLDFKNETAVQIERKSRALYPWPGTWCYLNGKRLKVISLSLSSQKADPGEVNLNQGTLCIGCKEGSVRLESVQQEGKKVCRDLDLLNGLKSKNEKFEIIFNNN